MGAESREWYQKDPAGMSQKEKKKEGMKEISEDLLSVFAAPTQRKAIFPGTR